MVLGFLRQPNLRDNGLNKQIICISMQYRRIHVAGGTYFFTVNLADRSADTLVRHIDDLRDVMYKVKETHPFSLIAMVVLPEHLHTI